MKKHKQLLKKTIFKTTAWFLIFSILGAISATPLNNYKAYKIMSTAKAAEPKSQFSGVKDGATEVVSLRNQNQKVFDNPDGTEQYIISSGLMHYKDNANQWQEINTQIEPATADDADFKMEKSIYKAKFKKDFTSQNLIKINKDDQGFGISLGDLSWQDKDSNKQVISAPQAVQGTANNNQMTFPNGYGQGLDYSYQVNDGSMSKTLTVPSLESLAPAENIADDTNLNLDMTYTVDKDMDIFIEGKKWDGKKISTKSKLIEFKSNDKTVWSIIPPRAWDSSPVIASGAKQSGNIIDGGLTVEAKGKQISLSVAFPYSWLKTAQYPVTIDPDTYYGETTDGYIGAGTSTYAAAHANANQMSSTEVNIPIGQYGGGWFGVYRGYLEFNTSGIDDAATVTQANLYMTAYWDLTSSTDFTVRIHKYNWGSPIGYGNWQTNYDDILASTYDANWRNTSGMSLNTPYSSSNLDTTWIQKGATKTQYGLLSDRDLAATEPTGDEYMSVHSQESTTQAYRPYLSITTSGGVPTLSNILLLALLGCAVFIAVKTGTIKLKIPKKADKKLF
jgi:hypothetical protein